MQYQLLPTTERDFAALFAIHKASMFDLVDHVWGWDDQDQKSRFAQYFANNKLQSIVVDGDVIGFLDVVIHEDHCFISNIEIEPRYQGRGVGSAVLRSILMDARHRNVPVRLQVLKNNNRARTLYDRLGFVETGQNETHYFMECLRQDDAQVS